MIKIGIIGCGAVVEKFHLPALRKIKGVSIEALVDKDIARVKELGRKFKIRAISDDYRKVLKNLDISLIALPNYLHAPVAIDCLKNGVNVFCEKPMAVNLKEAKKMVKTAKEKKKKLAVGMTRRYFKINQELKQKLDNGELGKIKSFEYEEGFIFSWPLKTTYVFDKQRAGGGVLMDMGSHVMDLIIWLWGKPTKIEYWDDGYNGVEANCQIKLRIGDIKGRIELSRNRTLTNMFKIAGQKEIIETPAGGIGEEKFETGIKKELEAFIKAITDKTDKFVSGKDVLESIKAIDCCYKYKKQIYEPWLKA